MAELELVRPLRTIVALLVLAAVQAYGEEEDYLVVGHGKSGQTQFESHVTREALTKTPVWSATAEAPPVSPRRAQQLAHKQIEALGFPIRDWDLRDIDLKRYDDQLHWYYVVHFLRHYPEDVAITGADFFDIVVLMDGTSVKPQEMRYSD